MSDDTQFQTEELSFRVDGGNFVVDCGDTNIVAVCGQNTARTFALPLPTTQEALDDLKAALQAALDDLDDVEI